MPKHNLLQLLDSYAERYPDECDNIAQMRALVAGEPRCFERDCFVPGHITGSAWVVDTRGQALLLTHHKKLNMWLQLGGHSDGDSDTLGVAMREAREEGGVAVVALWEEIFDIDIHAIPARKQDPAHQHFDVRFVLQARSDAVVVSDESNALNWVAITEIENYTHETSILRMRDKWLRLKNDIYQ
ncbi:MAG: NUDIX hydrolase [Pseudomonadota bacterium]